MKSLHNAGQEREDCASNETIRSQKRYLEHPAHGICRKGRTFIGDEREVMCAYYKIL